MTSLIKTYFAFLFPILGLTACTTPLLVPAGEIRRFKLSSPPPLLAKAGQKGLRRDLRLGGFSGLIFDGRDTQLHFFTHTDRGPNLRAPKRPGENATRHVVFPLPDFQPRLIRLALDLTKGTLRIEEEIPLLKPDLLPLTGLPNSSTSKNDEIAVDSEGKNLPADPLGCDLESLVRDDDGTFWMGDEYVPALIHFDQKGRMIERLVPHGRSKNTGAKVIDHERLPAIFGLRRLNRGFEGLTRIGRKLYAFLQSPIDPRSEHAERPPDDQIVRVLEYDLDSNKTTGVFLYPLKDRWNDRKIGDVSSLPDGSILVLEQTSEIDMASDKKIYRVRFEGASNRIGFQSLEESGIDHLSSEELSLKGIKTLKKDLVLDLANAGYRFASKAEGLTVIDRHTIAVVNDNDFGIEGAEETELALIGLSADLY